MTVQYVRALSNFRALPALLVTLIAVFNLVVLNHAARFPLINVLGPIWLTASVAGWRMRVPKGAREWEGSDLLPELLPVKFRPRVLVRRGAGGVTTRGGVSSSIVIDEKTSYLWLKHADARLVQYAHECAHIGMGESKVYGLISTGLIAAFAQALYIALFVRPWDWWIQFVFLLVGFLALRDYSRHRELGADFVASSIVGVRYGMLLEEWGLGDTPHRDLVSTHPSIVERVRALKNPLGSLTRGVEMPLIFTGLIFGFVCAAATNAAHAVQPTLAKSLALGLCTALLSILVGGVLSRPISLAFEAIVGNTLLRWSGLLVFPAAASAVAVRGDVTNAVTLTSAVLLGLVAAAVLAYGSKAILLVAGLAEVLNRPSFGIGSRQQRFLIALVISASVWIAAMGPYWSGVRSSIAQLLS